MLSHFLIPFISVALAELGDKTQLAVMLLATQTQKKTQLFLGVMSAFLLVDGAAIAAGAWIQNLIPLAWISMASGVLFLIFGVMALRGCECSEGDAKKGGDNPFLLGFTMVAAAEWGDKTQIASGVFAAKFYPLAVLAGTLAALTFLTLLALAAGGWISKRVSPKVLKQAAGILFIVLGFFFLLSGLFR